MPDQPEVVEADTAIGKFKVSTASLNNLATFASLILVCLIAYLLNAHAGDARDGARAVAAELRDSNKEVANALRESNKQIEATLKELARAMREQNCILTMTPERRAKEGDICKRISQ